MENIRIQDDLYMHVNQETLDKLVIPDDKPCAGGFMELADAVEKIMMDEEIANGIDTDVIDLISANIINERNPTCYGTDRRWANHLYPVFLTESYVKSKYISAEMFLHLF